MRLQSQCLIISKLKVSQFPARTGQSRAIPKADKARQRSERRETQLFNFEVGWRCRHRQSSSDPSAIPSIPKELPFSSVTAVQFREAPANNSVAHPQSSIHLCWVPRSRSLGMANITHKLNQTPWPEYVSELYRPSDRRLSAKLATWSA
jgi:hypothetical protein